MEKTHPTERTRLVFSSSPKLTYINNNDNSPDYPQVYFVQQVPESVDLSTNRSLSRCLRTIRLRVGWIACPWYPGAPLGNSSTGYQGTRGQSLRTKTISNKDHFVQGRPFRTKAQESLRTKDFLYEVVPELLHTPRNHFIQRPFRTNTISHKNPRVNFLFNLYNISFHILPIKIK